MTVPHSPKANQGPPKVAKGEASALVERQVVAKAWRPDAPFNRYLGVEEPPRLQVISKPV
jgi:hypothetical protein